jgi:hypothetical protein
MFSGYFGPMLHNAGTEMGEKAIYNGLEQAGASEITNGEAQLAVAASIGTAVHDGLTTAGNWVDNNVVRPAAEAVIFCLFCHSPKFFIKLFIISFCRLCKNLL